MLPADIPLARFAFTEDARQGISRLRALYDESTADPADIVAIAWGRVIPASAAPFETVVVTFYPRSMRSAIADAVQMISGLEVYFFAAPPDLPHFEGKVLDFADDRGFFLREP